MDEKRIEKEAERYAAARSELADAVGAMRAEQDEVKRRHLPQIRKLVAKTKERRDRLKTDVEVSPEIFQRPKSRILHGIRVGFKKMPGKLSFSDAAYVVKRIRAVCPDQADRLIKTEEKPVKAELSKLEVGVLKRIGCTVIDSQDVPIVQPTDDEIDRIVNSLIDSGDIEEEAA